MIGGFGKKGRVLRNHVAAGCFVVMSCLAFAQDERTFRFDIPQQSVQKALLELAQQAQLPILLPLNAFSNLKANELKGEYSVGQALMLLLEGTYVRAEFDQSGQLIVKKMADTTNSNNDSKGEEGMPEKRMRRNILAAAIAGIFSGGSGVALSQDVTPGQPLEEITVTGSRITQTSGFSTPVPVTTLSTTDLRDMEPGNTISQQLDALPQFFNTRTLQNAGPGGGSSIVGSPTAALNLRNLGGNRTLVLLNGSRVVPTDKLGAVNVDLFPTALMRSVDVVTGGASAAYGADAVGGVVNFVLDREFEGLRVNASYGQHEGGVGKSNQLDIAGGASLLDGRLHIIASGQSQEVDEVPANWHRLDNYQFWGHIRNPDWYAGAPAGIPLRVTRPWVMSSTTSPTGLIIAPGTSLNNMRFTADGMGITPFVPGEGFCQGGAGCQSSMAGGPEAELRKEGFNRVVGPNGAGAVSRSSFVGMKFDLTDRLAMRWEGMVGRTESIRDKNMRFYPILNSGWTPIIFRENAYLPDEVRQVMLDSNLESIQVRKQGSLTPWHDIGSDERSRDVFTTWNWNAGIDYRIPGVEWDLQANWQTGKSKRNSQMDNMLRLDRLFLASDAVVDPASGNIVCRVKLFNPTPEQLQAAVAGIDSVRPINPYVPAGTPGNTQPLRSPVGLDNTIEDCVPINIFGSGNMTQEALDYIGTWKGSRGHVDQDFAEVLMSGELYEGWGAGAVSFALGATWRDQGFIEGAVPADLDIEGPARNAPEIGIRSMPPSVHNGSASLHAQSHIPYVGGKMDVWEWFSELNVPIFQTQALFGQTQHLNANLAYRGSTYERSGKIDSWKVGLDFQLVDDVRLRLTRSHDVREPTFFELFDALANVGSVSDPRFGGEQYNFSQIQGGNPNLNPEEANTTVAGIVWQPTSSSWLGGLQVSLDWYQVKIEDSVALLGVQPIVDECERGVQSLCAQIERDPGTGKITRLYNTYLNVDQASTEGVDVEVAYRIEPDFVADQRESLTFRWLSGYVKERSNTPFGGNPIDTAGSLGNPDLTSVMTTTYGLGPWSVQLQGRFIDSVLRNAQWVEGVDVDDNTVSSMTWWNMRFGYSGEFNNGSAYSINLNIQNIFDREPPIIASFSDFGGGGQSVNPNYDIFGRRYNLNVSYSF
ncbi:MAG TPA: TonB-dependent receptor [Hyphomicrobiales bacterium]|nr:TonB-dependent receptor [Hyphomicrobiales bacterium]